MLCSLAQQSQDWLELKLDDEEGPDGGRTTEVTVEYHTGIRGAIKQPASITSHNPCGGTDPSTRSKPTICSANALRV
jgi:hypothetical protein